MKINTNIIFYGILIFHVLWSLFSFYSLFSDFTAWTSFHFIPFILLAFTLVWYGACRKNYIFGLMYIGLVMIEFLSRAAFRGSSWVENVVERLMFPVDLLFVAALLLLFKKHFGILKRESK